MTDHSAISAVRRAVKQLGGPSATARALNTSHQVVQYWLRAGVPPQHCLPLEAATGAKVTRYQLRPDIYGKRQ